MPAYPIFSWHNETPRFVRCDFIPGAALTVEKVFSILAIEQFQYLQNEIQIMDERKKDAVYELVLL